MTLTDILNRLPLAFPALSHPSQALYEQGATVVMACRNLGKADAAKRELVATYGPEAQRRIIPLHMDLEDFASIKR
jgi:NAD(P)-dependent dehydrogenase (short-subunit alcohol dehydrogenase family)